MCNYDSEVAQWLHEETVTMRETVGRESREARQSARERLAALRAAKQQQQQQQQQDEETSATEASAPELGAASKCAKRGVGMVSGIPKPVVWGTRGLHPGFPWFSALPWFP